MTADGSPKGRSRLASRNRPGKGAGGTGDSSATPFAGVHLAPHAPDHWSVVALLGDVGSAPKIAYCSTNEDIVTACQGATVVLVDAPLAVPNETGRRPLEEILAWCDVPLFPVSRERLKRMKRSANGPRLAADLAQPGRLVAEHAPPLTLRQLAWEEFRPPPAPALSLADYRTLWAQLSVPRIDSASPSATAVANARRLLETALTLPDGPLEAIDLSAISGAYAALRHSERTLGASLDLGTDTSGRVIGPSDGNLRDRVALNAERLAQQ